MLPFSPQDLAEFAAEAPAAVHRSLQKREHRSEERRPLALLVDDNEVHRLVGRGLVQALRCEVQTANDGLSTDAAPGRVNGPRHAHLAGLEATRRLQELQRAGEIAPFAIIAATADASDAARA